MSAKLTFLSAFLCSVILFFQYDEEEDDEDEDYDEDEDEEDEEDEENDNQCLVRFIFFLCLIICH